MCETLDLGIKRPHWHTLIFEGEVRNDMRYVCPNDVKKMLLQRARTVYWKWAAQHQYEELKEGIWLEPAWGPVAKEDEGRVDSKTWKRGQKIASGRELGAAQTFRHWLVG